MKIEKAVSMLGGVQDGAAEWLELPNGCMCCTIKTTAMAAIEELLKRKMGLIDHILLETTGLADPCPIVESFWADEALECRAYLDSVVCVVDGKNFGRLLSKEDTDSGEAAIALRQVALADVLLLNKTDLVDDSEVTRLTERLGRVNPLSKIVSTRFSRLDDLQMILGVKAYGSDADSMLEMTRSNSRARFDALSISQKAILPANPFSALKITVPRAVERGRFEKWLFSLLWERALLTAAGRAVLPEEDCILRVKGLLPTLTSSGAVLVQAVQDLYEINDCKMHDLSGLLVLLGRFTDAEAIQASFYDYVYLH
jgi:G3E family GTPase